MALTINNQPVDDIYTLTDRNGQKYNIHASALNAQNLKITAPDGTVIENPSPELLQQMRDYITQINQNKAYVDAQGQAEYPDSEQGEIKAAEDVSAPVNAVNQYFRRFKYDLANNNVPSGWYTLPAIGLTATGIGGLLSAPIPLTTATLAGGWLGGKTVDAGMNLVTGKSWAENMSDWTGLDKTPAEMTNPGMWIGGYWIPKYGTNVMRRGVETAMRTSPMQNGLESVINKGKTIINHRDYQRMKAIGKYIFTGKTTGDKGCYKSGRYADPENYYGGFDWIPENLRGKNDVIDAFLYGKEIDPGFGLYKKATGEDFGTHAKYIADNYAKKAKDTQVYSTSETEPLSNKIKVNGSRGVESEIETAENVGFDAAGHRQLFGSDAAGNRYTMEQDIWKFNPKEYMKKWLEKNNDIEIPFWKKALMRTGLEAIDYVGTPVIVRTPWQGFQPKTVLPGDLPAPPSEIYIDM